MNDFFHGFELIRAYIDDFLIFTKGDWTYHVQNLGLTINELKGKLLKCNIEFFLQTNQNGIFKFLGDRQWRQTHK